VSQRCAAAAACPVVLVKLAAETTSGRTFGLDQIGPL